MNSVRFAAPAFLFCEQVLVGVTRTSLTEGEILSVVIVA